MPYTIQSVIIPKKKYSLRDASEWILQNNFIIKKVDITKNFYRFRQHTPIKNKKYRIKKLPNDIELVIEY